MEEYKWTWLLPLKALCFIPALMGLVLVVMDSYAFIHSLSYEKHNLKISKIHFKSSYKGGKFLAGFGVTIKDSIHTSVNLESLMGMGICENKEAIERFIIKNDSIVPIWVTPSGALPALRMGKALEYSYQIKKNLYAWLLLLVLSIPVFIVDLIDKRVQKHHQEELSRKKYHIYERYPPN